MVKYSCYVILFILTLTMLSVQLGFSQQSEGQNESLWMVSGSSRILVEGSSNVNEFQCVTLHYEGEDILRKKPIHKQNKWELTGAIEMQVKSFDCESRMMTNDLREILKEGDYPKISINLLSLMIPGQLQNPQKVKGKVAITLAGTSRIFEMAWTLFPENPKKLRLAGTHDFTFSQFNLDPPTKMMGMIKVKDEITVDLNLLMEFHSYKISGND